mmetsp:Transcript_4979/g.6017  ORF Transcript_4979/g.6017 Transcript_4979/m.6017 type:complete len:200 (-) Transcript_4979:982-1581(-)
MKSPAHPNRSSRLDVQALMAITPREATPFTSPLMAGAYEGGLFKYSHRFLDAAPPRMPSGPATRKPTTTMHTTFTRSPLPTQKLQAKQERQPRTEYGKVVSIIRPFTSLSVNSPAATPPSTPPASKKEAIAPALAAGMPILLTKYVGSQNMRQYLAILISMYEVQRLSTPGRRTTSLKVTGLSAFCCCIPPCCCCCCCC